MRCRQNSEPKLSPRATYASRFTSRASIPLTRPGSLADYIFALEPRLCESLMSRTCFERILSIAQWLPPWLNCGFECRLSTMDQSVDFLVLAHDRTLDCLLPGLDPMQDLAAFIEAHSVWERIQALSRTCNLPGSLLEDALTDIWWEFDLHTPFPAYLVPNVFVGTRETSSSCYHRVMKEALSHLVSISRVADALSTATRCFEQMAGKADGCETGVMLARETKLLRLFMRNVPKDCLGDCLGALGWPGSWAALQGHLSGLLEIADCVGLDIDVGATVSPKLGVELGFGRRILFAQQQEHDKWVRLFDALVSANLCAVGKRQALITWTGGGRIMSDQDLYWKGFRLSDYPIYRALSHVKIGVEPGQPLSAKAYFGFIPVDKVDLSLLVN